MLFCVWGGGIGKTVWVFLVGWRDQEKGKVVKYPCVFLSLLAFLLYPGIICGCVPGKNRNSSESEIKVSLHSIPENLPVMEVEMLVQYRELESCSVPLEIFTAFSRLSVYLQKRSAVLLEIRGRD